MKALFLLLFSLSASAAIFGTDDRVQPSGAFRALARSTALQVPLNFVSEGNGKLDLDFSALSDRSNYNFCSDEPFASEKVSPIACTGFLVAPDLLVTAGHCAVNWTKVENTVLRSARPSAGFSTTKWMRKGKVRRFRGFLRPIS